MLRSFLVPTSFGQYGHYRGNAIAEIAALPISYAGHQVCEALPYRCSRSEEQGRAQGSCLRVVPRTAGRSTLTIPRRSSRAKLDTAMLCVRCHQANIAKPKNFPQVAAAEHSGGAACNTCHQPHSPAMIAGGSQ